MTVNDFVEDPDKEAVLNVGPDMRKINYSFHLLKVLEYFKVQCIIKTNEINNSKANNNSKLRS